MKDSIRIQRVLVKDLPTFADFIIDGAAPGSYVPITKQRARAHSRNPFADPDDVGLLVAWDGDQCVGYFGILPVMLAHEGRLHKVHWFTTWSVHPSMIGQGLGSALMADALELDLDFAIVGSAPARRVSAKSGFQEVPVLDYARIDFGLIGEYNPISLLLRGLRKLLSPIGVKLPIETTHTRLAAWFEGWLGCLTRPRLRTWALRRFPLPLNTLTIARTTQVTAPGDEQPDPERTGFYRDGRVVHWMLAHPWVLPAGESPSGGLDYAFTDARPDFEQIAWQIADSAGANLGYMVFQISQIREKRVLKVLDHDLAPAASDLTLPLALKLADELEAGAIEGSIALAALEEQGRLGRLLVQRHHRICQVHPASDDSPMAHAWPNLRQTYVDGDTAFT